MICLAWRAADDMHGTEVSRRLLRNLLNHRQAAAQPFETGLAALLRDRLLNHRRVATGADAEHRPSSPPRCAFHS